MLDKPLDPKTGLKEGERNYSEERIKRCEPLVKEILGKILEKDLLLTDVTFLEQLVKEQFDNLVKQLVYVHLNEVFGMVFDSLRHAVDKARDEMWGKAFDEVTVGDVDRALKNAELEKKNKDK